VNLARRKPSPNTCYNCGASVIWAQRRKRNGKHEPFPVEKCPSTEGNIALTGDLTDSGRAPLAEVVSNLWTQFRSHRECCPGVLARKRK
jgi:hypothetical protein